MTPTPRSREEEELLRLTLPALSRAFPDALILRNEANATTLLLNLVIKTVEDLGFKALSKPIRETFFRLAASIRYGLGIGSADVIVCHQGHFIALEFKAPKGVQSEEQATWQGWVRRAGGSYHLVRSTQEAIDAVRATPIQS